MTLSLLTGIVSDIMSTALDLPGYIICKRNSTCHTGLSSHTTNIHKTIYTTLGYFIIICNSLFKACANSEFLI